ncbi:hypothetical protein I553_9190 [Mycobacterium xenopi 4042]|uniref:Uncharacterized protein n=1 Tax=Mycobacterium xenopi 4042 TaxID=1299334 RepID=X8A8J9_MYCXE|nr:hypothetical protein I553_9190 [Mycobacterium xenopi 4042]
MVATITGLITAMANIFGPINSSPSAAVRSCGGSPRRDGQSVNKIRSPERRT